MLIRSRRILTIYAWGTNWKESWARVTPHNIRQYPILQARLLRCRPSDLVAKFVRMRSPHTTLATYRQGSDRMGFVTEFR